MSHRASVRTIAKDRLAAMGVEHPNKVMGLGMKHSTNRKLQRTIPGRAHLASIHRQHIPLWRDVTSGSHAKEGHDAQIGAGRKKFHAAR